MQALAREMAPRLHDLLIAYGRLSGVPVLLNTSFNLAGEPIVNRVVEGYSTFRRSRDRRAGRRRRAGGETGAGAGSTSMEEIDA